GAEKFRENDLPVAHRRGHERLNRAQLKLLGKEPHCDQRKNQDEGEPEENGIKKCFLNGILHLPLVHERNLEIEINAGDEQKENENDIGDGRVKITAHFAGEEGVELTHGFGVME